MPDAPPSRAELLAAARDLPDSGLKLAIVATLEEREPSTRECLAWASAIAEQLKEPTNHVGRA